MKKPPIVLFDLDSTLSHSSARYQRLVGDTPADQVDWVAYALAAGEDPPTHTVALAKLFNRLGIAVGLVSFRPEDARQVSETWLQEQGIRWDVLALLPDRSAADAATVPFKIASVRKIMEDWEVLLFVEDQHRIAEAVMAELGVPCMVVSSYPPAERQLMY